MFAEDGGGEEDGLVWRNNTSLYTSVCFLYNGKFRYLDIVSLHPDAAQQQQASIELAVAFSLDAAAKHACSRRRLSEEWVGHHSPMINEELTRRKKRTPHLAITRGYYVQLELLSNLESCRVFCEWADFVGPV